ncbi:MAG TPA: hypothetical protein VFS76_15075 [Pyrinomonadaceae bacterium]|nr:hypothetical protein [Pyrinomonadaceae bacterium]
MTPQAKSARELRPSDQQTPVIIKVGGDQLAANETKDTILVTIESLFMPFRDPGEGLTWETAQSTQPGRIIEVTFKDGDDPRQDFSFNPPEELVSVRIEYGAVELVVMESGVRPDNVFLTFAAVGASFNVLKADGGWTRAEANFPPITRVILLRGSTVVADYSFKHPENVDWNVQFLENT